MARVAERDRPGDADGQPGPRRRGPAIDPRVDPGRGDRPGPRGPLLERPAGQLLEAGPGTAHGPPARAAGLDWNLWLGAAPERPYHPVYCPAAWRGWFDFGTGALGDMAIHNMDPAFYALDLGAPAAVEARTSPLKKESYPAWQILTYEFAAKGRPSRREDDLVRRRQDAAAARRDSSRSRHLDDNGIYFVGDKGTMLCGGWSGPPRLVPESKMQEFQRPPKTHSPLRSAIAPSGSRLASRASPRTPRPVSPTRARSPRPCWSATWPRGCKSGSSGTA